MKLIYIFLIIFVKNVVPGNILFISPLPSASHHIWNRSIMEGLVQKGHNLTVLTVEIERSYKNMNFILMENVYEDMIENYFTDELQYHQNEFTTIKEYYNLIGYLSRVLTGTKGVQQLLNYPNNFKFDAILHDFTSGQFLLGFVEKFGRPPLISVSPFGIPPYIYAVSNTPVLPSYMPHYATTFTDDPSFIERFKNLLFYGFDRLMRKSVHMKNENRKAQQVFGRDLITLQEIEANSSLVLVNVDWSMDYKQPLPPNVIPVGGLQTKRFEPMNPDVIDFMQSSKPTILFSLGTSMRSDLLGEERINLFLSVFKSLPQYNFIWKFENTNVMKIPLNVMIVDWIPQNTVLSYSNIKLFITHGGLLSLQEATWHAVPIIGVPLFMDQLQNIERAVNGGVGEKININDLSEEDVRLKIIEVIENTKYRNKMKERSLIFRSQPMHPLDRAIFWIEHVIQFKGYLQAPAGQMSFFKMYMLDLVALIIGFSLVYILIVKFNLRSRSKNVSKKRKNK